VLWVPLHGSHGSGSPPRLHTGAEHPPSHREGSWMGGSTLTPSPCCLPLRSTYLFRPGLDPLPLLPPGSAPGTWGLRLLLLLVILALFVQALHQLPNSGVSGRGADLLVLLGGKPEGAGGKVCWGVGMGRRRLEFRMVLNGAGYLHNSSQVTFQLWSLDGVGLHQTPGDGFLAVLQAAVRGRAANAWEQVGHMGFRTFTKPGLLPRTGEHSTAV